jgi:hypothetical protein
VILFTLFRSPGSGSKICAREMAGASSSGRHTLVYRRETAVDDETAIDVEN